MENNIAENASTTSAYSCKGCGAPLVYKPGTDTLVCNHCGSTQSIPKEDKVLIEELDFEKYIANFETENFSTTKVVTCSNCKATPTVDENLKSMLCPYCGSPLIETNVSQERYIKPGYVSPFQISKNQVNGILAKWAKGLWFAPNKLQRAILSPLNLHGIYTPYWTYDTNTTTDYTGERGDAYYVTVGSGENKRQERRVRWRYVSGRITNFYDDVLIPASRTLDMKLLSGINKWDTKNIVKINDSYLAGFITEKYQIDLREGFGYARQVIEDSERSNVRYDIGGDEQRIKSMDIQYSDIKFKHLLLPIYISAFQYKNKLYTFYINGFTGHISGKRPYSAIKITFATIAALIIIGTIIYFFNKYGE